MVYLGFETYAEGIGPNPAKISAITKMKIPQNKSDVKTLLGICGYYRMSIDHYSDKAEVLSRLTHDDVFFKWGEEELNAFELLKNCLINAPVLAYPDFTQPFILQTDASGVGISGILCQRIDGKEKVILYLSRTLTSGERKWHARELEALTIMWSCETLRPYLIGEHFIVETDHQSLEWLMKATTLARLVRWTLRLSEFSFTIKYRSGAKNKNADALSRLPETV